MSTRNKIKTQQVFKLISAVFLCLALIGCTNRDESNLKAAEKARQQKDFAEALLNLNKVRGRSEGSEASVKAALSMGQIYLHDLKNYEQAAEQFRFVVLYSKNPQQRLEAQKQVAALYFESLNDYGKAIPEISRLLPMLTDPEEITQFRMNLARSYYYLNDFNQAGHEVQEFLTVAKSPQVQFDLLALKGNIFVAQKNLLEAAKIFETMIQNFPERSKKENIALTLAVCYEELMDFKSAIATLEKAKPGHPSQEYLDVRIRRLKERMQNRPGARGFRK